MIDLSQLAKIVANILGGVSILAVIIFAAVAYLKQWGVRGKWLTGSAFLVGVVIALLVRYAMAPMVNFADWVWASVFGLMAGALATGAYKGAQQAVQPPEIEFYTGPDEEIDYDPEPGQPL